MKPEKPKKKDHFVEVVEKVFFIIGAIGIFILSVAWHGAKRVNFKSQNTWQVIVVIISGCYLCVYFDYLHLKLLHLLAPSIFTKGVLYSFVTNVSDATHFFLFILLFLIAISFILGIFDFLVTRKYQNNLNRIGLRNAVGEKPKLVSQYIKGEFVRILNVRSPGIGIDQYNAKKADLMPSTLWIQERDKRILKAAFEHKVLDLESIYQLAFQGLNFQNARRRALKLCAHGYMKQIPFFKGGHHFSLFSVTEKGVDQIRKLYPGELQVKVLKSNCIEHDLTLFKIRQRLESLSMLEQFFTENMLQSLMELKHSPKFCEFSKLNSDAAAIIKAKDGAVNVAIEFENSEQSKGRYESRFKDYYIRREVHLVFYICARAQLMTNLSEIDRAIRGSGNHKIFFCLLENVLKPSEKLIFENLSKAKVVLN